MIYLELFLGFLKVGLFSFGGAYAAIPLIRDVVLSYGWINEEMLTYMIAVSESTPGPIMLNLATYVGTEQAGILGALVATLAVILPSFFIIIAVTAILSRFIENPYVKAFIRGVTPCMIGIVLIVGVWMIVKDVFGESLRSFDLPSLILLIILAGLYFGVQRKGKRVLSPILLIAISGVLGAVVYAI